MDPNTSLQLHRNPLKDTPISILGEEIAPSMNLENYSPGEQHQLNRSNIPGLNKSQPGSKSNISPEHSPSKLSSQQAQANLIPQQSNPQAVAVKTGSTKKKWIIGIAALLIVGAIIGGVLGYKLSTDSSSSSSGDYREIIKIPANYAQYKESIQAGQENNLIEVIHVPKSQKIYDYKLYNNQTTIQGDGKKKVTNSLIVHTFGLVCSNVTEEEFQMYIYIIDTKMYENGNLNNELIGFPQILEKEKAASHRNLKQNQQKEAEIEKENNSFMNEQSKNSVQNEYSPLSDEEIQLLAQKGISAEQYYQSRYPIIYFTLDKQSKVKQIQQPINLRLDIFQIYLNIIEQVTPIVKSDFYKVTNSDGSKKRMLSQYTQRMLSGDQVQPNLTAQVDEHGQANLNKSYEQNKVNTNDSSQSQNYSQNSLIQNGSLLESSAKSDFKIQDDKIDENGDQPLFKGIEMNSECKIVFVSQEDVINDELYNLIKTTFDYMSVLSQTQDEAIDVYNQVFNSSTSKGESHTDLDGTKVNGRMLTTAGAQLGPAIQKPIFRKNVASFEFGADVRSECYDSGFIGKEDICTVGLYSFFNGATMKIVEKQTRVNVSKILKYYQYIQHLLKDKLDLVKDKVNGRLTQIQKDLESVLDQLEVVITIDKNPVLKELYDVVNNDELEIFTLIGDLDIFLEVTLKNITKLVKDPFNVLKERLLGFLSNNGIYIESQINHIQSFVVDRLTKIKKLIEMAQTNGLPTQIYEQIFATLDNLEDLLIQVVDEPIKKYLDEVEAFILQQSNTIFSSINEVDKSISSLNQNQDVINRLKKIVGTSQIIDTLKTFINKTVKSITQQFDLSDMISKAMKKTIQTIKQDIYNQIEILQDKFPNSNNALSNADIEKVLSEFQNLTDFALDLNSGIKELKSDVLEIVSSLKKLQEQSVLTLISDLAQKLTGFPTHLLQQLKNQGLTTIKKAKDIGSQMKENILNWKDELIIKCKKLLADLQDIYADVKTFLKKTDFPDSDPNYYKEPLFSEVADIVTSVKEIVNYNYDTIGKTFERFAQIPDKFKNFVNDLKLLGQRTMNYFGDIKIQFTEVYINQKSLWNDLRSQFEQPKEDIRSQIQVTMETEYNTNLNKKAIPEINNDVNSLMNKDLAAYKSGVQENNFSVENLYKDLINTLIVQAEFEKTIDSPPLSIPFEYVYLYPTPIGITLKLRLYASWDNSLRFKLGFHNAVLDIGAGVNTKVTIGGEVGASVFVAEVGGYAEGVFLDTSLMFGLNFKVLEKFKGSFYIDATFSPYNIKMGLYYKTIFSLQVFKCASDRRRNLGFLSAVGGFLKSTVGAVLKNSKNPIAKAINKAINCLATLEITQKRVDIFDPINIKGETYKKRLYEVEFGPLQKSI